MARSARRAAPGPRLLLLAALPLLAALLPGAVTMLSPGRPAEPHAMEDVSPGRCVASARAPGATARGGAHHTPAAPPPSSATGAGRSASGRRAAGPRP